MTKLYHCYLMVREKTFFSIEMSRETIEDFDRQIKGGGLPTGASLVIRMAEDETVECTDILVEYRISVRG